MLLCLYSIIITFREISVFTIACLIYNGALPKMDLLMEMVQWSKQDAIFISILSLIKYTRVTITLFGIDYLSIKNVEK